MWKKCAIRLSAAVLSLWYLVSIIGFDIHTCMDSGNIFVASFLDGFSCEDIHPEHGCADCGSCCCAHSHSETSDEHDSSIAESPCCEDDYQSLAITGSRSLDLNKRLSLLQMQTPAYVPSLAQVDVKSAVPGIRNHLSPCPEYLPDKVRTHFCIWRI